MKQISNEEYEAFKKYKRDKASGRLNADYIRFVCEACNFNAEEIGKILLEAYTKHKRKENEI